MALRAASPGKVGPGRSWPLVYCLLALVGCRTPAARLERADFDEANAPCKRLACQVAADTAAALAHHPLRTAFELVAEPAQHACALAQGAVGKRLLMPLLPAPGCADGESPHESAYEPPDTPFASAGDPARFELYPDGAGALSILEHLIDASCCRVDVLMYQWENDEVGVELAQRLVARAAAGVHVRVLIDGGGNLLFGCPCHGKKGDVNGAIRILADRPNIEILRVRNPLARFDHRKLVLVDGKIAWTGGRNFTRLCFFENHDLTVTIEGPLVAQLEACFERSWQEQGGGPCPVVASPEAASVVPSGDLNASVQLLDTEPLHPGLERAILHAVDHACRYLYLENFTFSDSRLLFKLARARQRGVDVRVVMTLSCCCRTVNCTNRVTANRLLRAGVRVYIYPCMTHVKAACADGCWAYLGTGNFDPLSLRHNHELGFAIVGGPVIQEIEERLFQPDFCPAWELKQPLAVTSKDYWFEFLSSVCL